MSNLLSSMIIVCFALAIGFFMGRLWEIFFGSPGMSLQEAIDAEKRIMEGL